MPISSAAMNKIRMIRNLGVILLRLLRRCLTILQYLFINQNCFIIPFLYTGTTEGWPQDMN